MKYAVFVIAFLSSVYGVNSQAADANLLQAAINQYTPTCRGHAKDMFTHIQMATTAFNYKMYRQADDVIYMVDQKIKDLMISDDCSVEDIKLTMNYSQQLRPLENNTVCMLRLTEIEEYDGVAFEHVEKEQYTEALLHARRAQFVLDEIVNNNICGNMPKDLQTSVSEAHARHKDMVEKLDAFVND